MGRPLDPARLEHPHVLVVAPLYHTDRGGLGRQAVLLTERLAGLGVRPLVVTRRMEGLPQRDFAPEVEVVAVRAGRPRVHNYERKSIRNLVTALRFSAGLLWVMNRRRADYDLVHFHGASLPFLLATPLAGWRSKRVLAKVAALHQGVEAGDLRGHYGPLGPLLAGIAGRAQGFVATTEEIGRALRGEGYRAEQVARIPNFVDVERFHVATPEERRQAREALGVSERVMLLHSGRLAARKAVDVLLDAFHQALPRCRERAPLLLLLGDGPERPALESRVRQLGLEDHVRFEGFRERVEQYLAAADALVLASLIEGLPNALLEGMAAGLPVLATRLGGALEAVVEDQSGLLVPPADRGALAGGIERLVLEPELRARLGGAAARRIEQRFTLEAVAPRYVELYRELLGENLSSRS